MIEFQDANIADTATLTPVLSFSSNHERRITVGSSILTVGPWMEPANEDALSGFKIRFRKSLPASWQIAGPVSQVKVLKGCPNRSPHCVWDPTKAPFEVVLRIETALGDIELGFLELA
jgi:hypothetical protein